MPLGSLVNLFRLHYYFLLLICLKEILYFYPFEQVKGLQFLDLVLYVSIQFLQIMVSSEKIIIKATINFLNYDNGLLGIFFLK